MKIMKKPHQWLLASAALLAPALVATNPAQASDHADTAQNVNAFNSVADLTDLHLFPSPTNPNNVVFSMSTYGLIPAGQGLSKNFGTSVLYQFRIDTGGRNGPSEDLVIQATFEGTGANQRVSIAGPVKPSRTGANSVAETPFSVRGTINQTFEPTPGMRVFAGARQDPFFFDLERFFQIFPDRGTPLLAPQPRVQDYQTPEPNRPRVSSFRPAGQAVDFFANMNVLAIVIEMPRTMLRIGNGTSTDAAAKLIKVWMTTSVASAGGTFFQQDRLARPAISEVFASVTGARHDLNNRVQPNDDPHQIGRDITNYMRNTAGRSEAITNVVRAVLVPDVMIADLSQMGRAGSVAAGAAYLGVETGGATGSKFGGRKLQDDVVDADLGVIFGDTIPKLGLAPDDGKETPGFAKDNVGFGQKFFLNTFPYLGNPR